MNGLMQAKKFRKRPVVIEALEWDETKETLTALEQMGMRASSYSSHLTENYVHNLRISTLEGPMSASRGDWIICGVAGEFYACKPDIFAATYESAEPTA